MGICIKSYILTVDRQLHTNYVSYCKCSTDCTCVPRLDIETTTKRYFEFLFSTIYEYNKLFTLMFYGTSYAL